MQSESLNSYQLPSPGKQILSSVVLLGRAAEQIVKANISSPINVPKTQNI